MASERVHERPSMPIYLDYNATSPVAPRVITAMMPYLARQYGNASSAHAFGREAHRAMDEARSRVAALVNCDDDEIVFTGGGSEANNLALRGVVMQCAPVQAHILTSVVDHPSVVKTCYYLAQRLGTRVTLLPVDGNGRVDPDEVTRGINGRTRLVSIMLANNEVGTIQPVPEIAAAVRAKAPHVLIHTDAAQAVGKIDVDTRLLGVDLLTVAAHKFCGPKGVGALFVRRGVELDPLIEGAGHEGGRRSGTENIPGIVGLGTAAQLAREGLPEETERLSSLRDRLQSAILLEAPWAVVNGHATERLPNTLNVSFPGLLGNDILSLATKIAASTGAACHSGSVEPSSTLMSMGLSREIALGALRLSVGRFTTEFQVEEAAAELTRVANALRPRKTKAPRVKVRKEREPDPVPA